MLPLPRPTGLLAGVMTLVAAAAVARADVVHLTNGQTIEGHAIERGDWVDVSSRSERSAARGARSPRSSWG